MREILEQASQIVTKNYENSKNALKKLRTLETALEKENFTKLAAQLESSGFKNSLEALNLQNIYNELKEAFEKHTISLRMDFNKKFPSTCEELNLRDVKGDNTGGFRIRGILHVRVDFRKKITELKTFARSNKIKSLDPKKIAQESNEEIVRLFNRPFEAKNFLSELFRSYQKLQTESKKTVLLKDVHRIQWVEKQKDDFFETSDPAKMTPYPLDEFSIDLAKLMESKVQTTGDGYACKISLGRDGIIIYRGNGDFNSYKFLEFVKGEESA